MTQAYPTPTRRKQLKYERVKNHILGQIASRSLKEGDLLLPEQSLAEQLGVSRQTVRMVLRNLGAEGIVRRVQSKGTFVSEGQSRLDSPGSWQSEKSLEVYSLVISRVWGSVYPALLHGFGQAASKSEHQVIVCETGNDSRIQGNEILQLIDKNVAGVAIVPATKETLPSSTYQLRQLHAKRIPVVYCHRRAPGLKAPLVIWSRKSVGQIAGQTLAKLGHRQIAFVDLREAITAEYVQGLRGALDVCGIDFPDDHICQIDICSTQLTDLSAIDKALQGLVALLQSPERPTAIFANDVEVSEQVYLVALKLGLRVPEDLSILGFGPSWKEGAMRQQLAAVTVDEVELGRRAGQLLDEMRTGQRSLDNDEQIVLPLQLYEGCTLGPAPATKQDSGLATACPDSVP